MAGGSSGAWVGGRPASRISAGRRTMLVGLAAATAMLMSTSLAGAHGGDTNQVHGCVVPGNGTLRIIGAGESCRTGETALDWSLGSGSELSTFKDELKNAQASDTAVNQSTDPVSWFKLDDVPVGFADGDDAIDGGRASDLNCVACVSDSELSGTIDAARLSGLITGTLIQDGTLTAADLAGEYDSTGAETTPGAVTGEKIKDLTITSRDLAADSVDASKIGDGQIGTTELAAGAVKADKITANVGASSVGTPTISLPAASPSGSDDSTMVIFTAAGTGVGVQHVVQLAGQLQATASGLSSDEVVTVSWEIVDATVTATPVTVSPVYFAHLSAANPTAAGSVTQILPSALPGPEEGAAKVYKLKVTASSLALGGTRTVNITNAVITAIDLGHKP